MNALVEGLVITCANTWDWGLGLVLGNSWAGRVHVTLFFAFSKYWGWVGKPNLVKRFGPRLLLRTCVLCLCQGQAFQYFFCRAERYTGKVYSLYNPRLTKNSAELCFCKRIGRESWGEKSEEALYQLELPLFGSVIGKDEDPPGLVEGQEWSVSQSDPAG